eukprot:CAMPEP_0184494212 /NCGR_PEP_ID=MMETSP0113_2-20130426/28139_1 /TAXON_ID=91329 /ORGANISM="Norrisiella sphaerica, Strain BC52" /LENGTH=484 /DNA_ID=CAMNT_0026879869 /DNA_START=99 /DNA_END=1553 /DNA_ORIENTATION=+
MLLLARIRSHSRLLTPLTRRSRKATSQEFRPGCCLPLSQGLGSFRAFSSGPVKDFLLADIGEGIAEVEILEWLVEPGAKVEEFDELVKVQSDKAATEITSPYEGTVLELMVPVGEMAKVGEPLCRIQLSSDASEAQGEEIAEAVPSGSQDKPTSGESKRCTVDEDFKSGKVLTSPAVRRLAKENGVNLSNVKATGPKGRVLKEDILAYISGNRSSASSEAPTQTISSAPSGMASGSSPPPRLSNPIVSATMRDQIVPVRGLERIMVQTMTKAHSVPTLLYSDEFEMDELIQVRAECKKLAAERGVKLTYLPFIIKAASLALLEYPKMNAHVNEDCSEYVLKGTHNIGVAVQTASGLLVPNVKSVETKTVLQIASELTELQKLGHDGSLTKEHLTGGTFTISNIGSIGGTVCKPLLVVPEVAIAALGKFQAKPKFDEDDEIVQTSVMNVSLSADHRVIDGATVARFSNLWKQYLEKPASMLLDAK